jgi:hypothetical protein
VHERSSPWERDPPACSSPDTARPLPTPPAGYAVPTCHAALGWTASAPRGGFPWRRLPACVEAFLSTAGSCEPWPLVRRYEPGATIRLRTGSSFMPDRIHDRNDHIQLFRDQDGEQCDTHRIVSTAGAAAWLPHSTLRDTCITSGYGNPSSTCRHGWGGALSSGQLPTTAPIAIIPANTHVVDTSCG